MTNKKNAFSLIELSIVILIIGILVVGITQSSRLIAQFRLNVARNLTQSSAANSISGMVLWYETTSENSFLVEPEDGDIVNSWLDISPQSANKNNATADSDHVPTYVRNCLNSLPCIHFKDGEAFLYNGQQLIGNEYTIFVVEQIESGNGWQILLGGTGGDDNMIFFGYLGENWLRYGHFNLFNDYPIENFVENEAKIHAFGIDLSNSTRYYSLNSSLEIEASSNGAVNPLISMNSPTIGRAYGDDASQFTYTGNIFEVIMFNRRLKTQERRDIEEYLSKKWNITIATN